MKTKIESLLKPSHKALKAAAMIRLAETVKGSKVKPSQQAIEMAAEAMANKAMRERKT